MTKRKNPSVLANLKFWFEFISIPNRKFNFTRRLVSHQNKNIYTAPWNAVYFDENGLVRESEGYLSEIILPIEKLSENTREMIWSSMEEYDYNY